MLPTLKAFLSILGFAATTALPIPYTSVAQLITPEGLCTAFSINERQGYWVSDDHCLEGVGEGDDMTIRSFPVRVVQRSNQFDLVILRGPSAKALKVAQEQPIPGTPVFKWGHGDGRPRAWLSTGWMTEYLIFAPQYGHLIAVFDLYAVQGDSGAPIMTYDGQVVSTVENGWAPGRLGKSPTGGIVTPQLYEFVEDYLESASGL